MSKSTKYNITLPVKVYFRYGSSSRKTVSNGIIDTEQEEENILYAEGYIFHKADRNKSIRCIITNGRAQDIGCIYSSAATAASCILGRVASTEAVYVDICGKFTLQPLYERLENNPSLESLPLMHGLCWSYVPFNEWLLTQHNHCYDSDILCIPKVNRDTYLYQRPQLRLNEQECQPFIDLFEKIATPLCPTCAHPADSKFDLFCPECTTIYHENCINMSKSTFKCPLCNDPDVVTLANLRFKKRSYATSAPKQKRHEAVHLPNMSMHEWNNEDQMQSYSSDVAAIKSETSDFMGDIEVPAETDEDEDIELKESEIAIDFTKREVVIEKENKKSKAFAVEALKYGFEKLNTSGGEVTLEKIFYKLELNPWLEGFTRNKIKAPDLLLLTEADFEALLPIGPRRRLQAWLLGLRYFALKAEI